MKQKTAIEILSDISGLEKSTIQQSYQWALIAMELYLQQGIAHFISSKQDVIKSVCDHNWISSVAYKGARICSKCQTYK